MYITFENNFGGIRIMGGGVGSWKLIEISGTEPVQYDTQAAYLSGREGRVTSALQSVERVITLKGDIEVKNSSSALEKASQILDKEGTLSIISDTKRRRITARCTAFNTERERGGIRPFVMQFVCDDPFFTDLMEQTEDIVSIENLLYQSFNLSEEIYFSLAKSDIVLANRGTKDSEPVFAIATAENMQGGQINITNHTTGQKLVLKVALKKGDKLIVDIPARQIHINGKQRFDTLAADSFLSNFHLAVGANHIAIETNHTSDRLMADIKYFNKYNEAMI